jgi:hypothetical protein
VDRVIISYSLIFLTLFGIHFLAYDNFVVQIVVAYMLRICFAYFTVKIIGKNIDIYFINQIYFFTIISLIMTGAILLYAPLTDYIFENITPFFDKLTVFKTDRRHFIIYTMELGWKVEYARNSGPFWEPGGFAVFLFIALTFNIVRTRKFFNKKNVIFLIALVSTQSTTAYLACFVFCCIYVFITYRNLYSIILIPFLIFLFVTAYSRLDFMEEKINKMYGEANNESKKHIYSRIVSGKVNTENFLSSPIFGIGRFFTIKEGENSGNNGTTLLLAEFGLVGFLYYFLMMFFSYKAYCRRFNYNKYFPFAIIVSLLILGFSQGIFQKPFFMAFCFMFLVKYDTKAERARNFLIRNTGLLRQQTKTTLSDAETKTNSRKELIHPA